MTLPAQRIAIVGSRFVKPFNVSADPEWLARAREAAQGSIATLLRLIPAEALLLSGCASGVDAWASQTNRGVRPFLELRPGWQGPEGFGAGLARNRWLVDLATDVYVFWDGRSRGTAHTIREAQAAGKLRYVAVFSEAHPEGTTIFAPPRELPSLT